MRYATVVSEFMLLRRLDTIRIGLFMENHDKVHRVIENTVKTIADHRDKDIHESNLYAYAKNINMAQLLLYCDCPVQALDHVELAADVIYNNYPVMTPSYIMSNRMSKYLESNIDINTCINININKGASVDSSNATSVDIGMISALPDDVIEHINLFLYKHK